MKNLKKLFYDIFFPNRCPFCNEFIKWDKLACDECIDSLPFTYDELCKKCGKEPCVCSEVSYDRAYTVCYYDNKARDGIISLKETNSSNVAEFFAENLYEKIKNDEVKYDYIIPIPMNKSKLKIRGYNQAEEIAFFLSEKLNVPIKNRVILKKDNLSEQHTLNAEQRCENVKKEFYLADNCDISGKNIILCDDVMTTGSTISYCAELLKKSGAISVTAVVATVTKLNNS